MLIKTRGLLKEKEYDCHELVVKKGYSVREAADVMNEGDILWNIK